MGRLFFPSRGGLERDGVDPPSPGLARYPRARRSWRASPRVGSLLSSEVEVRGAVEGLDRETSSEAEIAPQVRGGCGWAALCTWAVD